MAEPEAAPSTTDTNDDEAYAPTQEKLLQATLTVVDEFGVGRATTRRIAAQAGVNIQLIQYYFGGKEAMLVEAQRYIVKRFFDEVAPSIADADSLADGIRGGVLATWRLAQERPELTQPDLLLQYRRTVGDPDQRRGERVTRGTVQALIEGLAARTGETLSIPFDTFALLATAGLSGLVLEYRASGHAEQVTRAVETFADRLVSLVESPPS